MSKCAPNNRLNQLFPATMSDVDSLLNHFFTGPVSAGVRAAAWSAPASVWEADERLHIEVDAPGVSADQVEVTVEKGQLTITVERTAGENPPKHLYNERRFGKVTRSLDLPESVDPESLDAELRDGVLRVSVAKRPETQPRKIEIKTN